MTSQTVLSPQVHQVMADHATNTYFMQLRDNVEARMNNKYAWTSPARGNGQKMFDA